MKAWETGAAATTSERQRFAAKATIRVLAGDVASAQADADKARELLELRLREHPDDVRSWGRAGKAVAEQVTWDHAIERLLG